MTDAKDGNANEISDDVVQWPGTRCGGMKEMLSRLSNAKRKWKTHEWGFNLHEKLWR